MLPWSSKFNVCPDCMICPGRSPGPLFSLDSLREFPPRSLENIRFLPRSSRTSLRSSRTGHPEPFIFFPLSFARSALLPRSFEKNIRVLLNLSIGHIWLPACSTLAIREWHSHSLYIITKQLRCFFVIATQSFCYQRIASDSLAIALPTHMCRASPFLFFYSRGRGLLFIPD